MDFQLEEQLKELMEERVTVQSQLDNFRKVASDDHLNAHKARRWVLALSCFIFLLC
jgi:centromeric protein E